MSKRAIHPPKSLQAVLWSVDVNKLDLEKDKGYIIHQIFANGILPHFYWVFKNYSLKDIIHTFTTFPFKDYRKARYSFIKSYILKLKKISLDERLYVKNTPRAIG